MSDTEIDQKPCDAGYEQCVEYRTRISDLFAKVTAATAREAALREALEGVLGMAENFLELHLMTKASKDPGIIRARAALASVS